MSAQETPAEDTVASGNHRRILRAGSIALAIMTLVGVSPLGSSIFGA